MTEKPTVFVTPGEAPPTELLTDDLEVGTGDEAVIGKGVETADQLRTLKVMGCTMAQGFYLAKPVTAESVEAVIEAGPAHEQSLAQPS